MAALRKTGTILRMAAVAVLAPGLLSCSGGEKELAPVDYPHEADTLVLSYRWTPGSTPAGSVSYWVYGDRRIVAIWMEPDEPAWSPVKAETAVLSDDHMQYFLHEMKYLGVLGRGPVNFGNPKKYRVGPVTLYVNAGGIRRQVTYESSHDDAPDLTREQSEKRGVVRNRIAFELGSASALPDKEYAPPSTALLIKPVDEKKDRAVRRWPLVGLDQAKPWDGNEVLGNRCLIVPSEKAEQITDAMKESTKGLVWRSGGEMYQVRPHPLLPHEKDCATVQPYFWPS